ncbi:SUMF1/EgtB/PvdO family nonheme iron enzyme [Psychroserpens algicola]|uniref:SUMF1/EgtB/PvdO family nonheme iron enzyme n=1 Tax=Psychroserpens algicola TaxID=1719034 RepID=A0ABT0HCZ6_9FLAO|nr:SUMF1/EgtB/PvdO family nonheme iron enzyme [Psychroserpens algicola]MCK8482238.1 SUMF1/EgtB/PvdO family nonheme iron enzyme [Psychroserpens algicola]
MKTKITLLATLLCLVMNANNITVSNISLENLNEPDWVQVEFDLSWENSWRLSAGPSNWDAAWVFIKYRVNSGDWAHAQINSSNFQAATGSTIDVSADGIGAFVYRDSDGSGDINLQNMRLRWDYGSIDPNDIIDIQVFAIEMVYVPEGSYFLGGTNGDENGDFFSGSTNIPYEVTSENTINVSPTAGNLYYDNTEGFSEIDVGDQMGPIPSAFPKGFSAYYIMKYEVSQAQWVDFFNTLTEAQREANDVTGVTGKNSDDEFARNAISWTEGASNATTTLPDVALNYVSAEMTSNYLDWAGLRHMTELEYEKSCRGPIAPKPNELAWGNANLPSTAYTYINLGEPNEQVTNPEEGVGNIIFSITNGTPSGPKRVGILAASAITKNREETGGSYYGIMELSGNLYERVITVGIPEGRIFQGDHGDGILSVAGEANVPNWPDGATGIGYRGGSHANTAPFILVSDRTDAANIIVNGNTRLGFRGVRSSD